MAAKRAKREFATQFKNQMVQFVNDVIKDMRVLIGGGCSYMIILVNKMVFYSC